MKPVAELGSRTRKLVHRFRTNLEHRAVLVDRVALLALDLREASENAGKIADALQESEG